MTLPINYRKGTSILASYNYFDIAGGTGVVDFYGGYVRTGLAVADYVLADNSFWSYEISTEGSTAVGADVTLVSDLDFDVSINRPLTVKGTCIVNVPLGLKQVGGAGGAGRADIILRKYSGGVETNIVQASGALMTVTAGSSTFKQTALYLDVPSTLFKSGDILRLTVFGWARADGGGTCTNYIGHDPKNRATTGGEDWGTVPTTLLVQIPTKINI